MKYPIGIQSFDRIREEGFVYVDKTDLVYRLATEGHVYFLSRPRRFGKSLLVSTLENYFLGRKELFQGLAIDRLEQEWLEYPVFHVDFNGKVFISPTELAQTLETIVATGEDKYGKSPHATTLGDRLAYVFEQAHAQTGRRVVMLVDEYDKPLLDVLGTHIPSPVVEGEIQSLEDYNRELLKGFYSVFKLADKHLRFVLLTGVTKFSQISVFSGFNQPKDISMDKRYEALCGITEKELYTIFADPIKELAETQGIDEKEMKQQLKRQYDGYHFSTKLTDIYNPFSLLNCFDSMAIQDYWFASGTPTYLVRLLNHFKQNINELISRPYPPEAFVDYKADVEQPLPMIYQSGYLTIKSVNPRRNTYWLDFPNKEVQNGFISVLASGYFKHTPYPGSWADGIADAFEAGDTESIEKHLTALLSETTYRMQQKGNPAECERYFQYTIYLVLRMISFYTVFIEKEQSQGRVDCIVEVPEYVYIFEFKLDGSAQEALRQIEEKGYARPYATDPRKLFRIGINFSSETGTISEFEVK